VMVVVERREGGLYTVYIAWEGRVSAAPVMACI